VFPEPPFSGFWALFFESFKDVILLILIAAAIVSFIVGMIDHPEYVRGFALCCTAWHTLLVVMRGTRA
jgi:magnesium-transporting ATPase (P-type)